MTTELGIDVWFQDNASLEGMYAVTPKPRIILGSHRPSARRRYTCAHELGHHYFGHGTRVDLFEAENAACGKFDPDEFLVQVFAGFLLMPKLGIANAFHARGWKIEEASADRLYYIASFFGVGYASLLTHMSNALGLLSQERSELLEKADLGSLRTQLIEGSERNQPLIAADAFWQGRPLDADVGDLILCPEECQQEGQTLRFLRKVKLGTLWEATQPGLGRISCHKRNWASFVRVSRKNYAGREIFRNLPEIEDNE